MSDRDRAPSQDARLFGLILAIVVISALHFAKIIFIPLALAMLFAFILTPLVTGLERMRLRRLPSICLVVCLTFLVIGAVGWVVVKQFTAVVNQLPKYQSNIEEKLESLRFSQSTTFQNATATVNQITQALSSPPAQTKKTGSAEQSTHTAANAPVPVEVVKTPALPVQSIQGLLAFLLQVLIVVVFTIFMLLRRENMRNRFISLMGPKRLTVTTQAIDEAGIRVGRYLRTQLAVNATYGTAIGIALHLIGIPGGLLWGLVVGVLRFLPYVGPPLGGIMPVILSLALFHGWEIPLVTIGVFVIVESLTSYGIEPVVYGSYTGVSPIALLVAAIFWTFLWGPIGLLLTTPLTVCLVVLGRHVPSLGFLPLLLGDKQDLPPADLVYQRLLARDEDEAEQIIEDLVARKSLLEVYDDILIPMLHRAEQEHHGDQIEANRAKSIFQSTREIVEGLQQRSTDGTAEDSSTIRNLEELSTAHRELRLSCIPARDEADELVGIMLSQVLPPDVHVTHFEVGQDIQTIISRLKREKPDIVIISALPPFVASHARSLFRHINARIPSAHIFVGLWNIAGDVSPIQKRFPEALVLVTRLADAIHQVEQLRGVAHEQEEVKPKD